MNLKKMFTKTALVAFVAIIGLGGCAPNNAPAADSTSSTATESPTQVATGGTLYLRVNPEIAVRYDDKGLVTEVTGENEDGGKLVRNFADFAGENTRDVVNEIIAAIGEAGYFVEEMEGQKRKITIELERGSMIPDEAFLADIVSNIRDFVNGQEWTAPVQVEGSTDYDDTDYDDTDYDGTTLYDATDYDDSDYGKTAPAQPVAPVTPVTPAVNNGHTDYTDYDDTDYTDYDDSDYGTPAPVAPAIPVTPPVTSSDSDYSDYDSGYSDYSDYSDYDDSDYGDSDYD